VRLGAGDATGAERVSALLNFRMAARSPPFQARDRSVCRSTVPTPTI
jgi:hypothetical protein